MQSRKDAAVIIIEVCKTLALLQCQWFLENEYSRNRGYFGDG